MQERESSHNDLGMDLGLTDMEIFVSDLVLSLEQGIAEQVSAYNLTTLDYRLLRACMLTDECTATQLVEVLPAEASRISRTVNRLVQRDLLARRRTEEDRRIVMLSLTERGRELILRLEQTVQLYYRALLQGISDEDMRVFANTCVKLAENYRALTRRP